MIRLLLAMLLAMFALAAPARADDNRPLTLLLEHEGAGAYRALWKVPANVEARHMPQIGAEGCTADGPRTWSDTLGHWREEAWLCEGGIEGREVAITYPLANPALATIVRYQPQPEAELRTILLQPQDGSFTISAEDEEGGSVFAEFLVLGVEHILIGLDHLLFVAGLIFIARTPRRILATITGFTIAHSITLVLSTLDLVRLPIAAVETVIALSIVFLAVEIVKGERDTLTWRRPVFVAAAFGLLHGFGFAAVLQEIGLPQTGFALALLAFNIGIEIGQIVFAGLVLAAIALAERGLGHALKNGTVAKIGGYGVGILATSWMFERMF